MDSSNRRKNVRVPCSFEAKAHGPRGVLRGTARNLSLGGLYFACREVPLPVGTHADIDVVMAGQTLRVNCEVRHHTRLYDGVGMGVKFLRLEPGTLVAIQRFVEANTPPATPPSP